jgi:hypothetical protein
MSVYNGGSFLLPAAHSILNQSFRDFEFIILDDGSTDGSGARLDQIQQEDKRVRVVHQENLGLIHALNRGCGLARGRYIARMDADDIALPGRLMLQAKHMESHPTDVLLGTAVEFINSHGHRLLAAPRPQEDQEIRAALYDGSPFWHPTVLFRKNSFLTAGGYRNVPYAEDYDLWLRMAERGSLANLPELLLQYRIHPDQVSISQCEAQAKGTILARASAAARERRLADPVDSTSGSGPAGNLVVSEREFQTTVARGYLSSVRNLLLLEEYEAALSLLSRISRSSLRAAEVWALADLSLCEARIHWARSRHLKASISLAIAIWRRPCLLGRPLKRILMRMSKPGRTAGSNGPRLRSIEEAPLERGSNGST